MAKTMQVGIDIGGTFTDLAVFDGKTRAVGMGKSPTTPEDLAQGLFEVLDDADLELSDVARFVHGTTIGTNAVIERHGAPVGLITTKGFRDTLEIVRIHRERHYDFQWSKPRPLVPRRLRYEVTERIDYQGRVRLRLDEAELRSLEIDVEATQAARQRKAEYPGDG